MLIGKLAVNFSQVLADRRGLIERWVVCMRGLVLSILYVYSLTQPRHYPGRTDGQVALLAAVAGVPQRCPLHAREEQLAGRLESLVVVFGWRRTHPWGFLLQGRLDAGVLQLTPGTHLLVDETALQSGQLQERGRIQGVGRHAYSILTATAIFFPIQA